MKAAPGVRRRVLSIISVPLTIALLTMWGTYDPAGLLWIGKRIGEIILLLSFGIVVTVACAVVSVPLYTWARWGVMPDTSLVDGRDYRLEKIKAQAARLVPKQDGQLSEAELK